MNYTFYVGTYSSGDQGGIFHAELDDSGEVKVINTCDVLNPSYLTYSRDKKYIFAVSETAEYDGRNGGSVISLKINPDSSLEKISCFATKGKDPCFVREDKNGRVWAANYSEGTATVLDFSGDKLTGINTIIVHQGKGVNPCRQEMAHIHCTEISPDENIAVCDLGLDAVYIYSPKGEKISKTKFPKGSGPRHIIFSSTDNSAYVITELSSEIYHCTYNDSVLTIVGSYKLLPDDCAVSDSTAAALKFSPDGKFLTATNRGHNSLVVFERTENGELKKVQSISAEGDFPRDFAYAPNGKWLLCANQLSEDITVFSVKDNGMLEYSGKRFKFPKPVMILF